MRRVVMRSAAGRPAPPWHLLSPAECLRLTETTEAGLTSFQAKARLARHGLNELPARRRRSPPLLFLRQFKSPLIYLLLGAAVVSLAIGKASDAGIIAAVLLINAIVGTVQEHRAEAGTAALQKLIRHTARVRRDGGTVLIDASGLVPGDVVELESGMAVPADIRLVGSQQLLADESTFSGESLPVAKGAASEVAEGAGLGDRPTMLHAGTSVTEGRGAGVVVATGTATALGGIQSSLLESPASPPPLLRRLQRLARQIAAAALMMIALLGGLLLIEGQPAGEILLLAVALAVSAIPEGLPIAVTVALAAAVRRMAARNVIVRSLPAVEGLGSCTTIASDKTGTLTRNRLSVERLLLASGELIARERWPGSRHPVALSAALCNEAAISPDGTIVGDTVDVALLRFAREAGIDVEAAGAAPRQCALPYEPVRKFAAVAAKGALHVKGAPEAVLPMCAGVPEGASDGVEQLASAGYRVLAIGWRPLRPGEGADCSAPSDLRLLGFVGLLDPVRPEVPDAIARCLQAGVQVRMVTGDHPSTAITVARALGLAVGRDGLVTGKEIAALAGRPDTLKRRILRGTVFARVEPGHKLTIVETLASSGEIVAVTGDGVNDAPALQAAQIGVAMGKGGTDVARDASDLVLADDNFASIVAGIEEGRITYANIRKIVIFVLATGIAEIAMFLGAVVTGLPMPLTAVQLLWANLITNGAQDVMLGFGRGEGDELQQPPRAPDEPLINRTALALMLPPAVVMAGLALVLLQWMISRGQDLDSSRNAVLLLVVLFQNVYVMCMRSERRPIWREPLASNPWLLAGVSLALLLHGIAMIWPPLGRLIGTDQVDPATLLFVGAGAVVILVATEVTKAAVAMTHQRLSRPMRDTAPDG